GQALAAQRRGALGARERRLRPRPRADDRRSRLGRRRLRGRDRRDHRRAAPRRALPRRGGGDGFDRDALPLGHGAADRGDARARQARALHRSRVPLRLRRARIGVATAFAVHAAVWGSFSARLPALKHGLGLNDGRVGLALFVMAIATVAGTRLAPLAVARVGSRNLVRAGTVVFCAALVGPAVASSYAWFC